MAAYCAKYQGRLAGTGTLLKNIGPALAGFYRLLFWIFAGFRDPALEMKSGFRFFVSKGNPDSIVFQVSVVLLGKFWHGSVFFFLSVGKFSHSRGHGEGGSS